MTGHTQLRFILRADPLLGCTLEACLADVSITLPYDQYIKGIDSRNFRSIDPRPDPEAVAGIRLITELQYETLAKSLSKARLTLPDILKSKPESFHKQVFRPMVDNRILAVIRQLNEAKIGIHYYDGQRIAKTALTFIPEPAEAFFRFDYAEGGLSYTISIRQNEEAVRLQESPGLVITENPCLVLTGKTVRSVPGIDGKRIRPFLTRDRILVPGHMEAKYFEGFIFQTLSRYAVQAQGFTVETVRQLPKAWLTVSKDWQGDSICSLSFEYRSREVLLNHESDRFVTMDGDRFPPSYEIEFRDESWEKKMVSLLIGLGFSFKGGSAFTLLHPDSGEVQGEFELIAFLSTHRPLIEEAGFMLKQSLEREYYIGASGFETRVVESDDWFDLTIRIRVGEYEFPFTLLRDTILRGERIYYLPDGKIFVLPREWLARFHDVLALGRKGQSGIKLRKYQYTLLEGVMEEGDLKDSLERISQGLVSQSWILDPHWEGILRPYQESGVRWMVALAEQGFGGCLADDMGLGKTIQTLALADYFRGHGTSLIVMPVSLLNNWESEIRKFTPHLTYYRHTGYDRNADSAFLGKHDLVLTTYGIIRNDIEVLRFMDFHFVILDESQMIKNADSETARAVRQLSAEHRLVLTGTPVENSITDLWSQMEFLNPGLLGIRETFMGQYAASIDRGLNPERAERIRNLVKPFILRRTKEVVAPELPSLTVEVRYCEPTSEQGALYEKRKSEIRNLLLENSSGWADPSSRMILLSHLLELRLLSNHPVLRDETYEGGSGKTDEVMGMISEIVSEGHKILIFSQFVMHLDLVAGCLERAGFGFAKLTGSHTAAERKKAIERFSKDPSVPVFLISLKAGGVGLNLTAADYVFLLDPWWNPAAELQAISRAHRIGQDKPVIAYKFITSGTIEEKVLTLQARKQGLADLMINENLLDLDVVMGLVTGY